MESASLSSFFTASHFRNGFSSSTVAERASRLKQVSLTQLSNCKTLKPKKRKAFEFACESLSTNTKDASQLTLSSSSSSNGFPKYDRLLPCPSYKLPPRIEHLVVTEESRVSDFICKALDLPPLFVSDLIRFGAVHHALVHPEPPPSATAEDVKVFREATAPLALRRRASLRGKTIREAQKTARIVDGDQLVEAGAFLRVHVHPKRYPRCYEIDWKSRIIAANESFVVLDKPAGTSVGGNVDNLMETCTTFAAGALGLKAPLRITHQIDNCTEGCVVLAKTKKYSSVFHEKIRERTVKKLYLALAAGPLPIGTYSHYMRPDNKAPRLLSEDFIEGWHACQLEIIECVKIPWPNSDTEKKHCGEEGSLYWPTKDYAYECRINLLTGRTHQIRAQLAALGAPIVGDSAYTPAALAELSSPGTNPFGKYGKKNLSEVEKETAVEDWIARHGKEPGSSIALQACQISWDEGKYVFQAGTPWWRL